MMMFTVMDWLDNSKLDNRMFQKQETVCEMVETINEIAIAVSLIMTNKKIKLNIIGLEKIQIQLRGDKQRFQQVLLNLLTNAVKYSPEEGTVELILKY